MKLNVKQNFCTGVFFLLLFLIWTMLVMNYDVQNIGVNGSSVGFAVLNSTVHKLFGTDMALYFITDWLGLVPVFICLCIAFFGMCQLFKRKDLFRVDFDILILGIYYIIVFSIYLSFEMIPINYRPILINGAMEVSYPSSTTLLVLSIMPTLCFQIKRRVSNRTVVQMICIFSYLFSAFMAVCRLVSGVHWFSDILGSVFISFGLFYIYKAVVMMISKY